MIVKALDSFGNVDTNYRGTVAFISSDPAATLPGRYTFNESDAGVHTFVNGIVMRTAGEQSVLVTDTVNPGVAGPRAASQSPPQCRGTRTEMGWLMWPTCCLWFAILVRQGMAELM